MSAGSFFTPGHGGAGMVLRALQIPDLTVSDWVLAGSALVGLALALMLAISLRRANHRALFASSREIVRAAEEIADGRYERVPSLTADDPLAPAASALARMTTFLKTQSLERERHVRMLEEVLVSAGDTAALLADGNGDVHYASPGAEKLFGWKSGEGRGQTLAALFAGEEFELLQPKLSRRTLKDSTLLQQTRMRAADGEFPAELKVSGFRAFPDGGAGFFLGIRDLREEQALRAELRESEEKHRTLAEQVPLGVFVVQVGRVMFANSAFGEMLQAGSEGLVGSEFREHLAAEDLLQVLDKMRRAESGEEPQFEMECRMRAAQARWPIEVILVATRTQFGGRSAVIGSVRDAGPDRGRLRQVSVSEAKLDAALDASEAVLLLSSAAAGGTVTLTNRRFEEMFAVDARALIGLTLAELAARLSPSFAETEAVRAHLLAPVDARTPAEPRSFEISRTGGAPHEARGFESSRSAGVLARTIELAMKPAYDRDNRLIGSVLSARDVTAHREYERRLAREREELAKARDLLQHANREVAEVNREVSARTAQVEKANLELRTLDEMKSNLLANVSHELQTPLVSIKGYTEMILKGRLGAVTEEQKKGLEVSLRNIDRLIGMINNLLNFSRIERDMAGMAISAFPLPEVIEEAIELVRENARDRRIALTTRYLTDDLVVRADHDKIAQVFINLLGNAVKYNREGGQVQVDVRKGKKGYLIVDVRDTGIGIPKESLDRIFDRYYRVGSAGPTAGSPGRAGEAGGTAGAASHGRAGEAGGGVGSAMLRRAGEADGAAGAALQGRARETGRSADSGGFPEAGRPFEPRGHGESPASVSGSGIGLSIVRDILRMHGCIIKAESALGEGSVFTFTLPAAGSQEPSGSEGAPGSSPGGSAPSSARPRPV